MYIYVHIYMCRVSHLLPYSRTLKNTLRYLSSSEPSVCSQNHTLSPNPAILLSQYEVRYEVHAAPDPPRATRRSRSPRWETPRYARTVRFSIQLWCTYSWMILTRILTLLQ